MVKVKAKDDLSVIFEKGSKVKLEKKVEINPNIKLPLKKGDVVGIVKAVAGNNTYGQTEAVVECDVKKMTFGDSIKKVFGKWLNLK
jgi:D-alanyl-D-alanine carboxypeptidase (penicillin-binding protein 5/6)